MPWAILGWLTPFGRKRVALHQRMSHPALAEAQSVQRALFAVRAFGVALVIALLAMGPNVDVVPYAGGVLALVVALTVQLAWFRAGKPQLAWLIALIGVVCDSTAGYLVGQAYIRTDEWVTFVGYPIIAMEAALLFGPIGAVASTVASLVAFGIQVSERAQLGFGVNAEFQLTVIAVFLLYAAFITVTVGVNRRTRGDLRALLDVSALLSQQESPTRIAQTLDARLRALVGARVRSIAVRRSDGTYEIRRWRTPETRTITTDSVLALSRHVGRDMELDMREGRSMTLQIERRRAGGGRERVGVEGAGVLHLRLARAELQGGQEVRPP
ncbi:MAG: hypothetical protein L0221_15905, partial [Chloroflexi bacterium]|nr:hypothetical protein [Chloroflexota bacterium]